MNNIPVATHVGSGNFAGYEYVVIENEGKRYVALDIDVATRLAGAGADMNLLNDIGAQDPDKVMAALLAKMKKPED
ncbi:hypothetical protein HY407_00500 [Candidatus Gottesmanbacteria bacterium]|nr:hypothetical protein [Candidatus Gottesmanbacteria bacterium]